MLTRGRRTDGGLRIIPRVNEAGRASVSIDTAHCSYEGIKVSILGLHTRYREAVSMVLHFLQCDPVR